MFGRILLFALAMLALPISASAQDQASDQEGTWALKINDAHIWVFTIERDDEGSWDGSWLRPARFEGNGIVFVRFAGEELVETEDGMERDGVIQLRFRPTQRGGTGDVLHFTMTGENEMMMEYLGTELEPYPLVRVVRGSGLGPFDENLIYDRDNAATQSDYDPADEAAEITPPVDEEPGSQEAGEEGTETQGEELASAGEESEATPDAGSTDTDEAGAEDSNDQSNPRIGADFLDGLDEGPGETNPTDDDLGAPEIGASEIESAPSDIEVGTEVSRACADLDRRNLPDPDGLNAIWGEDYEQLGNGLDVREYTMTNGDVARVTVLDDRIYLNRCGPLLTGT